MGQDNPAPPSVDANSRMAACKTCAFRAFDGTCRALPPVPILLGMVPTLNPQEMKPVVQAIWPGVPDDGLCSMFERPRPPKI
jgi:hypothetical protein